MTTVDLDRMPVGDAMRLLAGESRHAFDAFERAAPLLAPVVEASVAAIRRGGSVHLFGAGTSGRLAALDAAEVPPTFGVGSEVFVAHLAGGVDAMVQAAEDAEDDGAAGALAATGLSDRDVAIGVTASGRTPYVLAALAAARGRGSYTALLECNGLDERSDEVDCHVALLTGPEAIAGSTRLNAATAQKLALNAISTLVMVGLGRTYSNLMICVKPSNAKLRRRIAEMLASITGARPSDVHAALAAAEWEGDVALVMLTSGVDARAARERLRVRQSLRDLVERSDA